jgi:hypothetical protein
MKLAPYSEVEALWPSQGRHILASHDEESVVVYQAYRPAIGLYAAWNQRFGGEFSFGRMSWIKPNFLWMMFRCGWAEAPPPVHPDLEMRFSQSSSGSGSGTRGLVRGRAAPRRHRPSS